jgi:F-type H+-transporting ATPase subunit epsilon
MEKGNLLLEILSPEKSLFKGCVASVMLPGGKAPFTVLHNHAPIISTLCKGRIVWHADGKEDGLDVSGGFVKVADNNVTVCVEV